MLDWLPWLHIWANKDIHFFGHTDVDGGNNTYILINIKIVFDPLC